MKTNRLIVAALLCALFVLPIVSFPFGQDAPGTPRPIELADVATWRSISSASVSNDGQWFAYRVSPREGDGEVVVRKTKEAKELRIPGGSSEGRGGRGGRGNAEAVAAPRDIFFSEDSKWLVYTVLPSAQETRGRGGRGGAAQTPAPGGSVAATARPSNKLVLMNLATEKKVEFEKIRRAAFSGENPNWLALHRNLPETAASAGGRGSAAGASAAATGAAPATDRATGSDLLLRDLNTGADLNIGNVSEFAFDKKGNWLAWIIDAQDKAGNGVQIRNMSSGVIQPLESDKASYRSLAWTEKGDGLAVLKGVDDSAYEEKLYSLVAFTGFSSAGPQTIMFDPKSDKGFPDGMSISPNRAPSFSEDLSGVYFGIHEVKKKKEQPGRRGGAAAAEDAAARPDTGGREVGPPGRNRPETPSGGPDPEKPDLVIWHYLDPRLQSQQQVEETRDKNFNYLCVYRIPEKKFVRLSDDTLRQVTVGPEARFGVGLDNREYELMGNMDGRRYSDIYSVDAKTSERKLVVKKSRWNNGASPDGTHLLYYDDGNYFTCDMATGQSYNITKSVPTSFIDVEDDHNVVKPPVRPVGWAKGSASVLLSDGWDVWNVPVHGGQAVNLTVNGRKDQIRYRSRIVLDTEEGVDAALTADQSDAELYQGRGGFGGSGPKGIDLSKPLYFSTLVEANKKGGVVRIEPGPVGGKMLLNDDAQFAGFIKAKSADVVLYTRQTFNNFPDYYVTDTSLRNSQKITEANPQQKDFLWASGSKLIQYTSAKGDKLQAMLFLPANYQEGKSYPTVVYIYEKLTQNLNAYLSPASNGFNPSTFTSNGYAVLEPDIVYKLNDPGMSAVWCVVPAVKAAIATGIVDAARVGIQGHSWGGYQTAFLVTQTDVFRAAIAGAPLTNMISMYSSIYWNTGGGDNAIFESSQGRFLGGYWDNLESYQRNSPVYHARNVKTPLMILHNDRDGAVDFNQGIEYFNTLRRLQKPVVMLQYRGENHGLAIPANMKDYTARTREFFDHYLKDKPAPPWLKEGVPLIKIKEHIDAQLEQRAKEKTLPTATTAGGDPKPQNP